MRAILADPTHPLTKATSILYGRIDFYNGYRNRTLIKPEDIPVVGTDGPQHIVKVLTLFKELLMT